nr:hypothetical protein GCM10020185_35460 [Pseudomonas brassicacearum subsp. brassicacearum]
MISWRAILLLLVWAKSVACNWRSITLQAFFFAVEADARVGHVVGDDQVEVLVLELACGVIEQVFGLGGKADTERAVGAGGDTGQDVRVAHHLQ